MKLLLDTTQRTITLFGEVNLMDLSELQPLEDMFRTWKIKIINKKPDENHPESYFDDYSY